MTNLKLLAALFATFALGLVVTGVVIGLLPAGGSDGCGKAFSGSNAFTDNSGCAEARAERRALPVALIGVGATSGAAALVVAIVIDSAGASRRKPELAPSSLLEP